MYQRPDGIVDFDKAICIGCKACIAACPYDAIFINPQDHSAEKCNFCAHRLDMGLEPACVVVCPTEAILVGDLEDPATVVTDIVQRGVVAVRRPEKETHPKLFYRGAHQATLDPIAAARPDGGLFMWSQQRAGQQQVVSGHPTNGNSSAAALLSYDVPHKAPWDWRVSLYSWTKGIACGVYLVALLLLAVSEVAADSILWQWITPVLGGVFLAATGGLLLWDLEHPERFYLIFTRSQRRSWLVKGAYLIAGYSLALGLHVIGSLLDLSSLHWLSSLAGLPLAVLTAVYTAYLFAQAKARDLWQNPLHPPHLLVQSVLLGSAVVLPFAAWLDPRSGTFLLWTMQVTSVMHLLFVAAERTLAHTTAHARLAAWEMVRGQYGSFFWASVVLMLGGVAAPWIGAAAVPLVLVAILAHEHAYIQAGQSVPLA
jgi:ferredoxin